jgi:hypothetical protein
LLQSSIWCHPSASLESGEQNPGIPPTRHHW